MCFVSHAKGIGKESQNVQYIHLTIQNLYTKHISIILLWRGYTHISSPYCKICGTLQYVECVLVLRKLKIYREFQDLIKSLLYSLCTPDIICVTLPTVASRHWLKTAAPPPVQLRLASKNYLFQYSNVGCTTVWVRAVAGT